MGLIQKKTLLDIKVLVRSSPHQEESLIFNKALNEYEMGIGNEPGRKACYLYVLGSSDIEEGDWYVAESMGRDVVRRKHNHGSVLNGARKIMATTDRHTVAPTLSKEFVLHFISVSCGNDPLKMLSWKTLKK